MNTYLIEVSVDYFYKDINYGLIIQKQVHVTTRVLNMPL